MALPLQWIGLRGRHEWKRFVPHRRSYNAPWRASDRADMADKPEQNRQTRQTRANHPERPEAEETDEAGPRQAQREQTGQASRQTRGRRGGGGTADQTDQTGQEHEAHEASTRVGKDCGEQKAATNIVQLMRFPPNTCRFSYPRNLSFFVAPLAPIPLSSTFS